MNNFKFDTHLHLDLFRDRNKVIRDIENNKSYTIAVTNLPVLYEKYLKIYSDLKYIKFALGFHPELVYEYSNQFDIFLKNVKSAKYIGEIGLDYKIKNSNNRSCQRKVFSKIVSECNNCGGKVLTVHSRNAVKEINEIIGDNFNGTIIMHWFTGTMSELKESIRHGYYFSINERMINKSDFIKRIPINKILLETDAPFINNDRINYSFDFVDYLINKLANIFNINESEMSIQLKSNFKDAVSV